MTTCTNALLPSLKPGQRLVITLERAECFNGTGVVWRCYCETRDGICESTFLGQEHHASSFFLNASLTPNVLCSESLGDGKTYVMSMS